MPNVSFTRDEVILALDVLYSAEKAKINAESEAIHELSELLNELPIHALEDRRVIFRNESGIFKQLMSFRRSMEKGEKNVNVGMAFYTVGMEFENRIDELHDIAKAIRHNKEYYYAIPFGSVYEDTSFPEGTLLGHLHRVIELRDKPKHPDATQCAVCQLDYSDLYKQCGLSIEQHLITPITELDYGKHYSALDYVPVCPNCHAALHHYRPWIKKKQECVMIMR